MSKEVKKLPVRSEIPVENTWDLSKIFPSLEAFDESYAWVESKLPEFEQFKGKLGSAETLLRFLNLKDEVELVLQKICVYAAQSLSVDMTNTNSVGLYGRAENLMSLLSQSASFVDPELIALGDEKLQALKENESLAVYRRGFDELRRQAKHVQSAQVEQVLAELQPALSSIGNIFETFTGTLQFPAAVDSQGEKH
ncbi:MAG: oligoendopeptidase F, partial [Cyanobacteria bacterium DS2.3.42]|nr:oligoendopeptidase F [Cyanobacteria bacterium DS2.3.42]